MKNIIIAHSGSHDWIGIYVDGVLLKEDHSFTPADMLRMLGISYREITAPDELIENLGSMPETFKELDELIEDDQNCQL